MPAPNHAVQVWFTSAEAAAYTRMSVKQLLRYATSEVLRGEQVGGRRGHWRFHVTWLDEFMSGRSRRIAS